MQRLMILGLILFATPCVMTPAVAIADDDVVSMDLTVAYDGPTDTADIEWFPAFPDAAAGFEILCYDEAGEVAAVQQAGAEDRTATIADVDLLRLVSVKVRSLDAEGEQVEITPEELFQQEDGGDGGAADDGRGGRGQIDATFVACDSRNFPFIYITLKVTEDGQPIDDLTTDNFTVTEDGRLQTDFFDVTPPATSGGVRLADIVFLIDTSGSMGGEITAVKNNCIAFANALASSDVDYRLGLVQFGNSSGANPRIIGGGLTASAQTFKSWVSGLYASGGYEPGFAAIRMAIQNYNFRPGAQKVFLVITDEDSDDLNKSLTIDLILANQVTVHCAANCSYGKSQSHYCNSTSVRGVSGGLLFGVKGPYDQVLDTIASAVSDTYIVRYKTDNPAMDGQERFVDCTATKGVSSDTVSCTYIPGGAPEIQRTADTLALHGQALVAGSSPTISATVTDAAAPFVQKVTLHVRVTGSGDSYTELTMTHQGGDLYAAAIPGSYVVADKGVDYYIRATDGQVTSSDPSVDPETNPHTLAVDPNYPPVLNHTPPPHAIPGQDVSLLVEIADSTYYLAALHLHYRPYGTLLWQTTSIIYPDPGPTEKSETLIIPGSAVPSQGVEYRIEAVDDIGVTTLFPAQGAHLLEASAAIDRIEFTGQDTVFRYNAPVFKRGGQSVFFHIHLTDEVDSLPNPTVLLEIFEPRDAATPIVTKTLTTYWDSLYDPKLLFWYWDWTAPNWTLPDGTKVQDKEDMPVGTYSLRATLKLDGVPASTKEAEFYVIFNRPTEISDDDYDWYLRTRSPQIDKYDDRLDIRWHRHYDLHIYDATVWKTPFVHPYFAINGLNARDAALAKLTSLARYDKKYSKKSGQCDWWDIKTFIAAIPPGGTKATGACTDFSALLIAYARAVGIPARAIEGFYTTWGKDYTGHSWTEGWTGWNTVSADQGSNWMSFDATDNRTCGDRNKEQALADGRKEKPLNDHFAETVTRVKYLWDEGLADFLHTYVVLDRVKDCALNYTFMGTYETEEKLKVVLRNTGHITNERVPSCFSGGDDQEQGDLQLKCTYVDKSTDYVADPVYAEVNDPDTLGPGDLITLTFDLPMGLWFKPKALLEVRFFQNAPYWDSSDSYMTDATVIKNVSKRGDDRPDDDFFAFDGEVYLGDRTIPLEEPTFVETDHGDPYVKVRFVYVRPDDAELSVQQVRLADNSLGYVRHTWSLELGGDATVSGGLRTPLYSAGSALHVPGRGLITTDGPVGIVADYLVACDSDAGTDGDVTVFAFSEDTTVEEVAFTEGPEGQTAVRVTVLSPEYQLAPMTILTRHTFRSTCAGAGRTFEEIYADCVDQIHARGHSLATVDITVPAAVPSGSTLPVGVTVGNNGCVDEAIELAVEGFDYEPSLPPSLTSLYQSTQSVTVPAQSAEAREYEIPVDGSFTPWAVRIDVAVDGEFAGRAGALGEDAFEVTLEAPEYVAEGADTVVTATVKNTWDTPVSNVTVGLETFHCASLVQEPPPEPFGLGAGESTVLTWTVSASDQCDLLSLEARVASDDGGHEAERIMRKISHPAFLACAKETARYRPGVWSDVDVTFRNIGDDASQDTCLTLQAQGEVDITDPTQQFGEIGAGGEATASWTIKNDDSGRFVARVQIDSDTETKGHYFLFLLDGDLDDDDNVDRDDLMLLLGRLHEQADGPDDPYDLDHDGKITILDARTLVTMCTLPGCVCE